MSEHLIVLAAADRDLLGALRTQPGLLVAEQGDRIWLRGIAQERARDSLYLSLPALARYQLGEDQLLFVPGALAPTGYLPKLTWTEIAAYLHPEMPVAAYGGTLADAVQVQLVASDQPQKEAALRCALAQLQAWVEGAAEIRIQALRFAVAEDGMALVIGDPLPTIPGEAFWECGGMLLPAGRKLEFSVLAPVIRQQIDPEGTHLILFEASGGYDCIPQTHLIQATRSGIRLSTITS